MWLLTKIGFFSIVQKPWDIPDDLQTVRARNRSDLENFQKILHERFLSWYGENPSVIHEDLNADYQFRLQAPRQHTQRVVRVLVEDIDYDNFKDAVAAHQGYPRARLYERVWAVLFELQSRAKRFGNLERIINDLAGLPRQIKDER